jgi:hypothetical protein
MDGPDTCQQRFSARWPALANPHVRALAWLLDSPDLLDEAHPCWEGKIAHTPAMDDATAHWLNQLDKDPAPLLAALGSKVYTRLGLYAEKLMSFYLQHAGRLLVHGLQVRAARNDTVGEFDFLLADGDGAEHWEFATKFYLLEGLAPDRFDALVGPNLADSLGAKMRKITSKQLQLAWHPAAQAVLPRPVTRARALVKGWLFYPHGHLPNIEGITANHCRGYWCEHGEPGGPRGTHFAILPRLQWLAPYRTDDAGELLDQAALASMMSARFSVPAMPALVASMEESANGWVEQARSFIVPPGWRERAAARRRAEQSPA